MEATVNINVKVSLEEATIQRIREFLVPRPAGIEARPAQGPRPAVPEKPQAAAEPAPKSAPAPAPEEPVAPIDNMVLMNAVKDAKERGKADGIRALFAQYGIASSRDCPQEKRKDLLTALNAL